MMENLPEGLLDDVKNYLDISWDDPATDKKLASIVAGGMYRLERWAGRPMDYTVPGDGRTLLFEYVRYARDAALDVFENNYEHMILAMQSDKKVQEYEAISLSSGQ